MQKGSKAPRRASITAAWLGLTPAAQGYVEVTFECPDEQALLRGNRANGPVVLAERTSGAARESQLGHSDQGW